MTGKCVALLPEVADSFGSCSGHPYPVYPQFIHAMFRDEAPLHAPNTTLLQVGGGMVCCSIP